MREWSSQSRDCSSTVARRARAGSIRRCGSHAGITTSTWRAEAKTNPAILDGTGMTDPEDIGVMRMQPLDMITQKISANGGPMTEQRKKYCLMVYNNLMNMVIGPRIIAVVFDD
mmetsp:Transcript_426/g.1238  ORF Transcript_426/g.1238 Transcript_426/m.1238 type:complete len:114 (-) Transcript_426:194-535(-)